MTRVLGVPLQLAPSRNRHNLAQLRQSQEMSKDGAAGEGEAAEVRPYKEEVWLQAGRCRIIIGLLIWWL